MSRKRLIVNRNGQKSWFSILSHCLIEVLFFSYVVYHTDWSHYLHFSEKQPVTQKPVSVKRRRVWSDGQNFLFLLSIFQYIEYPGVLQMVLGRLWNFEVTVNGSLQEKVCGFCGDMNRNRWNDMIIGPFCPDLDVGGQVSPSNYYMISRWLSTSVTNVFVDCPCHA